LTFEAVFLNIFLKQFRKLHGSESTRIRERVKLLCEDPYVGLPLKGDLQGFWKDRVGNYRIIYKIDETGNKVIFYDVGLRKSIYE
jgi:mRNA interferase RelE/StbE